MLLLSGHQGLDVDTDLIGEHMQRYDRPVMVAVNALHHPDVDFDATAAQAQEHFGTAITIRIPRRTSLRRR